MNISVFRLIFDYRGKINRREFLYGILVLIFATSMLCVSELLYNSDASKSFGLGFSFRFINQINDLIGIFLPTAPLSTVILYSSFVIAVKRLRSRGSGIIFGIIAGFFIFLGFKSLVVYSGFSYYRKELVFAPPLAGLIIIIILSLKNAYDRENSERPYVFYSFSWNGRMNDTGYLAHIAKIYIWSFIAAVTYIFLIFLISCTENRYEAMNTYGVFISFCMWGFLLIMSVMYINISVQRIRDIGFKGRWVPIILVTYISLMVLTYYPHKSESFVIVIPVFFLFITNTVIWFSQFLLLIVPSDFWQRIKSIEKQMQDI